MTDAGVLLSLPMESIAIRVVVASVAAVAFARLLLRGGLRLPGVRAATALVPASALVIVTMLFWNSLRLPYVMLPVDAVDALPIPVRDSYLHFAPMATPLLVGLWGAVATMRIAIRLRTLLRAHREVSSAIERSASTPMRVRAVAAEVARSMRVPLPPVAVIASCPGGASVVGLRRPIIVLDDKLASTLDDLELQGVLAHELAHVKRRDNLVAMVIGTIRDMAFFVPGGRWAIRQLHCERELAADQVAVDTTRRPAALASGLLKVIETTPEATAACSALAPDAGLIARVHFLIDDRPPVTRVRGVGEIAAVAFALTIAVVAASRVPGIVAGAGERDVLAVLWSNAAQTVDGGVTEAAEARAFQVYRAAQAPLNEPQTTANPAPAVIDDDPAEVSRRSLAGCATGGPNCYSPETNASLGLRPRPVARIDHGLVNRWRATPLVSTDDGLSVYWLKRLE